MTRIKLFACQIVLLFLFFACAGLTWFALLTVASGLNVFCRIYALPELSRASAPELNVKMGYS